MALSLDVLTNYIDEMLTQSIIIIKSFLQNINFGISNEINNKIEAYCYRYRKSYGNDKKCQAIM